MIVDHIKQQFSRNGHSNFGNLSNGVEVPLQVGDVLLFSANMIHRGLYGKNRLALDILYYEHASQLIKFIQLNHQPSTEIFLSIKSRIICKK